MNSTNLWIVGCRYKEANRPLIHLGYRLGRNTLIALLEQLQEIGVNHVTFNIRFSTRPVDAVLNELCQYVVPEFPALHPDTH